MKKYRIELEIKIISDTEEKSTKVEISEDNIVTVWNKLLDKLIQFVFK